MRLTCRVEVSSGGLFFYVKVIPGSRREGIVGIHDGMIKVAIHAPPEKGKANQALVSLLADFLSVPRQNISIVRGESSRQKKVEVETSESERILRLLADIS